MILQIDIERNSANAERALGFYRMMVVSPLAFDPEEAFHDDRRLPSYWMYNGAWHYRTPPELNPPKPWEL